MNCLKILQEFSKIPELTPRILENPTKFLKYLLNFKSILTFGGGTDGLRPFAVAAKPPGKRYHSSATHAAEPSYQRTISGVVPLNRYLKTNNVN